MPTKPQPQENLKAESSSPDNPSLAATGEFPHSPQREEQGEGVKDLKKKSKSHKVK